VFVEHGRQIMAATSRKPSVATTLSTSERIVDSALVRLVFGSL